jgi:hypothetical protein
MEEWKSKSMHYYPRHWMKMSDQLRASAALPLEKEHLVPIYGTLDEPRSRSGQRKFPTPAGNRTPVVQSAASHFIDQTYRSLEIHIFLVTLRGQTLQLPNFRSRQRMSKAL